MITELCTAIRRLFRSPTFAFISVMTFAVGIGAGAAIFSVVQGVLISPLPYPDADQLVGVWHTDPETGKWPHAHIAYLFYREQNTVFEDIGLYLPGNANLSGGDRPEELPAVEITPSLLRVFGVQPSLGRAFREREGEPGADPTVIISHALWQRRFGGDSDVIGSGLWIDGVLREVVGVMPPGFRVSDVRADLMLPMEIDQAQPERGMWGNICVARLLSGQTEKTGRLEMDALSRRVYEAYPDPDAAKRLFEKAQIRALVTPLKEDVVGGVSELLWILFGCVGVVLAVVISNVTNLFLVRADARQQETALRSALGATRAEILRGMTAESLIVSVAGGAGGLAIAAAGIRAFRKMAPPGIPRVDEVGIGLPVVLFVVAVATLGGLVFAAVSALRGPSGGTSTVLGDGGRSSTSGRSRTRIREVLVVSQLALALVLIVMSGLMVRGFLELRATDPGCDPRGVMTMRLPIPRSDYPGPADALAFYREVLEKVRALPGIELAGVTTGVPVEDSGIMLGHSFEDLPLDVDAHAPNYTTHLILPDALEVLSIPLLAGRRLSAEDLAGEARNVLVSESLARRIWPDPSDAVGRRVMPGRPQDGGSWYTIVGVVGDAPYGGLANGFKEALYYPFWSLRVNTRDRLYTIQLELVIKSSLRSSLLARAAAEEVWAVNPDIPVANIRSMEEVVSEATVQTRFTMMLLLAAAGVAILLGAVGLYGAIAYVVAMRTREIGIRVAMGAGSIEIRRMVVRRGLVLSLVGVGIGLLAAMAAGRVLLSQLHGVSGWDPITFILASVLMVGVALIASYLPARRAAAMDPLEALRHP